MRWRNNVCDNTRLHGSERHATIAQMQARTLLIASAQRETPRQLGPHSTEEATRKPPTTTTAPQDGSTRLHTERHPNQR
jgi:hypothetical protein